jgi:hypothetical protein
LGEQKMNKEALGEQKPSSQIVKIIKLIFYCEPGAAK